MSKEPRNSFLTPLSESAVKKATTIATGMRVSGDTILNSGTSDVILRHGMNNENKK